MPVLLTRSSICVMDHRGNHRVLITVWTQALLTGGAIRRTDAPPERSRYALCKCYSSHVPLTHPLLAVSINLLPSLGERWEFILCDPIRQVSKNELSYGFSSPNSRRSWLSNVLRILATVWKVFFLLLRTLSCLLNNRSKVFHPFIVAIK